MNIPTSKPNALLETEPPTILGRGSARQERVVGVLVGAESTRVIYEREPTDLLVDMARPFGELLPLLPS